MKDNWIDLSNYMVNLDNVFCVRLEEMLNGKLAAHIQAESGYTITIDFSPDVQALLRDLTDGEMPE